MTKVSAKYKDLLKKANAMAVEWAARSHAYFCEDDISNLFIYGFCKSGEEARACYMKAVEIKKLLVKADNLVLTKDELSIIKAAALERECLNKW